MRFLNYQPLFQNYHKIQLQTHLILWFIINTIYMKFLTLAALFASTIFFTEAALLCDPIKNVNNRCVCTSSTDCQCKQSPPIYAPDSNGICYICPYNDYCTTCSKDNVCKVYNDQKCAMEKTNGKTNVAGTSCFKCEVNFCQRCKFTNLCESCIAGYKLNGLGECQKIINTIPCPTWCDVCFKNSAGRTRCAECHDPLRRPNTLYTACFPCAIAGCLKCNSTQKCSECLDSYTLSNGICNLK